MDKKNLKKIIDDLPETNFNKIFKEAFANPMKKETKVKDIERIKKLLEESIYNEFYL